MNLMFKRLTLKKKNYIISLKWRRDFSLNDVS